MSKIDSEIQAMCPCCRDIFKDIKYEFSGASETIRCNNCGFLIDDIEARKHGYDNVIRYWNTIGIYFTYEEL